MVPDTQTVQAGVRTDEDPLIGADVRLPEITVKAVILGAGLAMLLGVANAYVGLKVGMTVSASIPAAVMSMAILRSFSESNVLENNIVQTMASAGESLAAGVIFTIPALIFLEVWTEVHLLETFLIALLGGLLGVLFTIPLRRALVVEAALPFPEGVACAQVLKAGEEGGEGVKVLGAGVLSGALFGVGTLGLRLWGDALEGARRLGGGIAYAGVNLSPILLAVGYIVGARIGAIIFLGSAIAWFGLIPLFMTGIPGVWDGYAIPAGLTALQAGYFVWDSYIRLVGGGAMITGGFYALYSARDSLKGAFTQMRDASRGTAHGEVRLRTDHDMDLGKVAVAAGLLMVPIFGLYWYFTGSAVQAAVAALLMGVSGFFFSSVAGYMAGVVGSSNNPISGVTIVTLIFASLLLLAMGASGAQGMLGALGVGAVIACAGAIAGDNLQDLKTGRIVGATPWKQQVAQLVGVSSFALVAAPALVLLHTVYGIGTPSLPAPQAGLMGIILTGVFNVGGASLDWNLVFLGMAIGVALILARVPVMAAAVGIYLPFLLTAPILLGGLLRLGVDRYTKRAAGTIAPEGHEVQLADGTEDEVEQTGILFTSGIIAGEAITGILLAFLFLLEPSGASRAVTGVAAPTIMGLLVAGGVWLLGTPLGGARKPAAAMVAAAGVAASAYLWSTGFTYTFASESPWPGALVLVYIALLMVYVPLRPVLLKDRGTAAVDA